MQSGWGIIPRGTGRTVASGIAASIVMQAVDNTALAIKPVRNHIEKLAVASFILSPKSIGHQISVLDTASRFGIYEERHVSYIVRCSPSVSASPEFGGEGLQTSFARGFVQNNQASLRISSMVKTSKEQIETVANLLEGIFHWVFGGAGAFVHYYAKELSWKRNKHFSSS